jgi:hypothetical protein
LILISKCRSTITIAGDPTFACVSEFTGAREIKQEGVTVTNKLRGKQRFPLSFGEASYTVPIFNLKKRDGRTLVVTARVEV